MTKIGVYFEDFSHKGLPKTLSPEDYVTWSKEHLLHCFRGEVDIDYVMQPINITIKVRNSKENDNVLN